MRVIVHGGAGSTPDHPGPRATVLDEAAATGAQTEGVVDAVVAAVGVLESAPRFNAGVDGARQSDGAVRTDAGVMTDERAAGAVCSMPGVEHAIEVARIVLEDTPHVLIAGEHAVSLAVASGIETDAGLLTDRTRERWNSLSPPDEGTAAHLDWVRERFDSDRSGTHDHDTVGAVAVHEGRVAAATSTGGRWCALAGRVGDVPQVGSGFYATPAGGASATGAGEDIARVTLSRLAVDELDAGHDAGTAADRAITAFEDVTGSTAGVIVADADSEIGSAHNTDSMQTSSAER